MAEYYAQPVEYPSPPVQPDGRAEPRPEGMPLHAHEGTDVAIRPLVITGVGLVIFLIATCVFVVFLFELYATIEKKGNSEVTAVTAAKVEVPASAPPLQGIPGYHENTPAQDQVEFFKENQHKLRSFSTATNGVARIPVLDEKGHAGLGMELALERKLFPAATQPSSPNNGAVPATAGSTPQPEKQGAKAKTEKETE